MSTDHPDEENQGEDVYIVDEQEMIDESDDHVGAEISAEAFGFPAAAD